jgi:transcriptional regulator with XRE-family HTH domain
LPKTEPEPQAADLNYGLFVREFRSRRGLTLDELSDRTGLSKGHLSRFERGEKFLSVAALLRVANALDVSVSAMLGESITADALYLVRSTERTIRKAPKKEGGYSFATLSRPGPEAGPTTFVVDYPARAQRSSTAYHAGEELFFVLKGRVEIELPGRTVVLEEGDYLQFPGHLKHTVKGLAIRSQLLVVVVNQDFPAG